MNPDCVQRMSMTEGIERGHSSVGELVFGDCMLPAFSIADTALTCKSLTELDVRWAEGPFYHFFIFSDLCSGLASHKRSLGRLVLDVSKVKYYNWQFTRGSDTVSLSESLGRPSPGQEINNELPSYEGIGSLKDFSQLRHLEISVCLFGMVDSVDSIKEMMPESLDSLVFLGPLQYGQPSIEELVQGIEGAKIRSG
ncbi:Uu.00g035180.m01.CDS01 [Anthostomella pinea]|uniref:Uu.00g035180.m01.CDS01 n=1 Tax=Anthostomella pinea TaxID=933095 RepID=A0AAI8VA68_9PEZI|nr:Uu.00g035180.m01.CDS01 [Anthostomella pinea]